MYYGGRWAFHSLRDYTKKKVMIMFGVVRDNGARMTRYTINHSVKNGGRQAWRGGGLEGGRCRGQWQFGEVMWSWTASLWRVPPLISPSYHTISPSVATSLFLFLLLLPVTLFSLTSHVFFLSIKALCLPPGAYLLGPTVTHTAEC